MGNEATDSRQSRPARHRWRAKLLAALVGYVIAVAGNLLIRSALHDWTWQDDLLGKSLTMALIVPAVMLLIPARGST